MSNGYDYLYDTDDISLNPWNSNERSCSFEDVSIDFLNQPEDGSPEPEIFEDPFDSEDFSVPHPSEASRRFPHHLISKFNHATSSLHAPASALYQNIQPQKPIQEDLNEEKIDSIQVAGLTLTVIQKKDEITYKLPRNIQINSLNPEQRKLLLEQIQTLNPASSSSVTHETGRKLHPATVQPPPPVASRDPSELRRIIELQKLKIENMQKEAAKKQEALKMLSDRSKRPFDLPKPVLTTQTIAPSELTKLPSPPTPSSDLASLKPTRKYIKTGKYSKKKAQAASPSPTISLLDKHYRSLPSETVQKLKNLRKRVAESLVLDHHATVQPDHTSPFSSKEDVYRRLLPYHIYQTPKQAQTFVLSNHSIMNVLRKRSLIISKHEELLKQESQKTTQISSLLLDRLFLDDMKNSMTGDI